MAVSDPLLYLGDPPTKKRCSKCREYRDVATEYHRERGKKFGVRSQCRLCRCEVRQSLAVPRRSSGSARSRHQPLLVVGNKKRCSKCRQYKPLTEYYKSVRASRGVMSACKECERKTDRKYKSRNDRFWKQFHAKTKRVGNCLEWTGFYANKTPACAWDGKKNASIRRVVYRLAVGELPDDEFVTMTCKNPRCVRQSHMKRITETERRINLANSHYVGRGSHPGGPAIPRRATSNFPCGILHPMAKLTSADVLRIRELDRSGISQRAIARQYRVSHPTIHAILHGKTWAHVQ